MAKNSNYINKTAHELISRIQYLTRKFKSIMHLKLESQC